MALLILLLTSNPQAQIARDVRTLLKDSPLVKCVGCNGSGKELVRVRRKGPSWTKANGEYHLPTEMSFSDMAPPRVYYNTKPPKQKLPSPTAKCRLCGGSTRILPRDKSQQYYQYTLFRLPTFAREHADGLSGNRTAAKKFNAERSACDTFKWRGLVGVQALVQSKKSAVGKFLTVSGKIEASTEQEVIVEAVSSTVTVITIGRPPRTRYRDPVYVKVKRPVGARWIDGANLAVIGRVVGDTTYFDGEMKRPTVLIEPIEWR